MHDAAEIVERVGAVLAGHPVLFAYLFGSVARSDAGPGSDVDVAVHLEPGFTAGDRFVRILEIGAQLEATLRCDVDVVDLEEAPLRLAGRILTERIVVIGLDRPERVRYETAIYRPYVDLEQHAHEMDVEMLEAMGREER